ncbi:hypothetical protein L2E82_24756 [Cichorium intybus]|uniref:Uncharacterized protein n=1 Tax=Cichorium intybus TaxID=13427 RepID=A0ACB9E1X9_CICIN|nr:hypothetical protein L2E82_24756 [Cichorium intybus]
MAFFSEAWKGTKLQIDEIIGRSIENCMAVIFLIFIIFIVFDLIILKIKTLIRLPKHISSSVSVSLFRVLRH